MSDEIESARVSLALLGGEIVNGRKCILRAGQEIAS